MSELPELRGTAGGVDEAALLRYAKLCVEIEKVLAGREKPSPKAWWRVVLESAAGAALVTVAVGGLLGGWITRSYQGRAAEQQRESEIHRASIQAIVETLEKAAQLAGEVLTAGENLIVVSDPNWGDDEDRREFRKQFNELDRVWRSQSRVLALLLASYETEGASVYDGWRVAQEQTQVFLRCAKQVASAGSYPAAPCESEHREAVESFEALVESQRGWFTRVLVKRPG